MTTVSIGMANYLGGLSSRPKPDEGPLWFGDRSVGFGADEVADPLIAVADVRTVVVEKTGRRMSFWPAWLLTSAFGILGFAAARRPVPATVVTVRLTTGETALFRIQSFGVEDSIRLLRPWLERNGLPISPAAYERTS